MKTNRRRHLKIKYFHWVECFYRNFFTPSLSLTHSLSLSIYLSYLSLVLFLSLQFSPSPNKKRHFTCLNWLQESHFNAISLVAFEVFSAIRSDIRDQNGCFWISVLICKHGAEAKSTWGSWVSHAMLDSL